MDVQYGSMGDEISLPGSVAILAAALRIFVKGGEREDGVERLFSCVAQRRSRLPALIASTPENAERRPGSRAVFTPYKGYNFIATYRNAGTLRP